MNRLDVEDAGPRRVATQRSVPGLSRRVVDRLDTYIERMAIILGIVSAVATVALIVLVMAEVVMRNILVSSVPAGTPIGELLLAVAIFGGLAYTQLQDGHVRVEVVETYVPERWLAPVQGMLSALLFACLLVMAYFAWQAGLESLAKGEFTTSGGTRFPRYPARFAIAFGFLLNALVYMVQGYRLLFTAVDSDETGPVGDSVSRVEPEGGKAT